MYQSFTVDIMKEECSHKNLDIVISHSVCLHITDLLIVVLYFACQIIAFFKVFSQLCVHFLWCFLLDVMLCSQFFWNLEHITKSPPVCF